MIVWELDLETRRFTHVSGRVAAVLGYPLEAWQERPGFWIGVVHPEDRARIAQAMWRAVRQPGACEIEYRTIAMDGRILRMRDRVRAVADEAGRSRVLRAASLELSDPGAPAGSAPSLERERPRRRTDPAPVETAQEAAAADHLVMRASLLDSLGEAVVASDVDHRIVYWNRAAEVLLGWTAEEAIGRPDLELLPARPSREQTASIVAGLVHGRPWAAEVEVLSRHGVTIPVLMTVAPVRTADGVSAGVAAVITDLRRLRASEAKSRRVKVMDVVARMAGGLARELEETRERVDRSARALLAGIPPHDPVRNEAEDLVRGADALASLAVELQSVARERPRQPASEDLNAIVSGAVPLLHVICGDGITLRAELDRTVGQVEVDARHITQVILNIAANACAAMGPSGRLTIRTAGADLIWPSPGGTPVPAGRYVVLEIRDSRDPPPLDTLPALFEPYAHDQPGFRLSIAHALVTQNDGFIAADATPDGGLVFRVYLPRAVQD